MKEITSKISQDAVRRWVGTDAGKIIGFKLRDDEEKNFHIVFTRDGISLREGEYPACECTFVTSEEILKLLASKELGLRDAARSGKLTQWGNFHEGLTFANVVGWRT